MSIRTILLGALAALVAIGGVYLLIEVRSSGAAAPTDLAVNEAAHGDDSADAAHAPRIEDLNADRGSGSSSGRSGRGSAFPRKGGQVKPPRTAEIDRQLAAKLAADSAEGSGKDPAVDPDFDSAMLEANKLYDRHNYEEARTLALKLLERQPGTVRMLRVVVSSSCILGDGDSAQKYWTQLPEFDRGQMSTRCERFGVTFTP
jgi:hypothetical protein